MAEEKKSAYRELRDELGKTAVISSDFKSYILGMAMAISEEAYERGVQEERKRHQPPKKDEKAG